MWCRLISKHAAGILENYLLSAISKKTPRIAWFAKLFGVLFIFSTRQVSTISDNFDKGFMPPPHSCLSSQSPLASP